MPEKPESTSEIFSNVAKLFLLYFCGPNAKGTSQARIKSEIFVNSRPELGPNPTRKAWPDLQLWTA